MTPAHKIQVAALCAGWIWLAWVWWQEIKEFRAFERARKARIRARG